MNKPNRKCLKRNRGWKGKGGNETENRKVYRFQKKKKMNIEDNQRRYNIISIGVATKGNQNKGVEEITRNSNSKNIFWKI